MTNIFIESGDPRKNNPRAVNTNEYIFIKTIVELCTRRKDKVDYDEDICRRKRQFAKCQP